MMHEDRPGFPKPPQRRFRWGRFILLLIVFFCSIALFFFGGQFAYSFFFGDDKDQKIVQPVDRSLTQETLNRRVNILLLGIDDGDNEFPDAPKRTDTMMVASIDPDKKEVALLSIPRDTRDALPGYKGLDKINHAYAYGGVALAKQTVANLLQVPIHYHVTIDWHAFIQVVDILGGVDIYVDNDMEYEDPYANLKISLKKGYQHLDGAQAGQYVRFRSDEMADIGRIQRQQRFMKAMLDNTMQVGTVFKLPSLMSTLDRYVNTDMSVLTMVKTANSLKSFGNNSLHGNMLPGEPEMIGGVSYWVINPKETREMLDRLNIPYVGSNNKK